MKRIFIILVTLIIVTFLTYSCMQFLSTRVTVNINRGSGNNYYEIEIITNSLITLENTNSFQFSLSDPSNCKLEIASGNLENGYATWTSLKQYHYGLYVIVVKIDKTGDENIGMGDEYSYKYIIIEESNNANLNFSDTDNWYYIN